MRPLLVMELAVAAIALAARACGTSTASATLDPDDAAAGGHDGGGVVLLPDGAPAFCQGQGPSIALPDGTCTGDIGKKTFLFAVCACGAMSVSGTLKTDSVDSTSGTIAGNGASIGVGGSLSTQSDLFLQGSVYANGGGAATAVTLKKSGTITRDLRAGGAIEVSQPFRVDGDLFTAGDVTGPGTLSCGGQAHVAPGRSAAAVTADGGSVSEAVSVPSPCDCTKSLDVAGLARAFATTNDDVAAGVSPQALAPAPAGALALPCGRYYFDAIEGDQASLQLAGRTAIFVGGDVKINGVLDVALSPFAELDLFIAGDLSLGGATLGSTLAAARVRVYVGGTRVELTGGAHLGANLYAPRADVAISSDFEMSGALFVQSVALSGNFTLHYDEAILTTTGCQKDAHACATCHDCAGSAPACKGSVCVPCVTSDDCCAPLRCNAGRCVADLR